MTTVFQEVDPLKFSPGILSAFIVCVVLYVTVFVLTYSYYFNNVNKLYRSMKIKINTIALIIFLILMFLVLAIWLSIDQAGTAYFSNNQYMLPMAWVIAGLGLIHLMMTIAITKVINKRKKQVDNFRNENFQAMLEQLQQHKPSDEYLAKFKTKNARYYAVLEQKYKIIDTIIEQYKPGMYSEILANLIMFNDTETTRWSKNTNYLQLEMFLNLCIKLQQKAQI